MPGDEEATARHRTFPVNLSGQNLPLVYIVVDERCRHLPFTKRSGTFFARLYCNLFVYDSITKFEMLDTNVCNSNSVVVQSKHNQISKKGVFFPHTQCADHVSCKTCGIKIGPRTLHVQRTAGWPREEKSL